MIRLLQIDGSIPNIALMRLSAHYKGLGEVVEFHHADSLASVAPLNFGTNDLIFASTIFARSKPVIDALAWGRPDAVIGGTGYDFTSTLEGIGVTTEVMDYSIYPNERRSNGLHAHRLLAGRNARGSRV